MSDGCGGVGPHFGTVPVPALGIQLPHWDHHVPKLAQCQLGVSGSGTGLKVILQYTQFWHWVPSSGTGHPMLELGVVCETPNWHTSHFGTSAKIMGRPDVSTSASKRLAIV